MEFTLMKKNVVVIDKESGEDKKFTNYYLVNGDNYLPIQPRVFKDRKSGEILNKTDLSFMYRVAVEIK